MTRRTIKKSFATIAIGMIVVAPGCAMPETFRKFADTTSTKPDMVVLSEVENKRENLNEALREPGSPLALMAWAEPIQSDALQVQGDSVQAPLPIVISPNNALVTEATGDTEVRLDGSQVPIAVGEILPTQPINLGSALAMTAGQNPEVNFARQRITEAFAQLQAADTLWLPSIRAGANYNKHEGRIQDVAGQIIETSRGSIYTGLGSQAVGASSPAVPGLLMDFHLTDAIFQPRIASQTVAARRQASRAVSNDLLMETAIAYVDLLEAMQVKAVAEETYGNADQLAKLTTDYAETGQGLAADADRASAELSFRDIDIRRADEAIRVASVRLTRLLHADQSVTLVPVEPMIVPIELVKSQSPVSSLVSTGLLTRPELSESRYLVREAIGRYDREKYAPLVPSVLLGMSYGGNGGGLGGDIDRFGDRMDFDAAAWWEVRNLGYGEKAARNAACSRVEQAKWQQVRIMDQVAAEVAQAHAEVSARRDQITISQSAITSAEDSYRRNSERIRDGQGLPIETLQAVQALNEARRQYIRIIADYNRSQFRLQRALGWPVDATQSAIAMQGS